MAEEIPSTQTEPSPESSPEEEPGSETPEEMEESEEIEREKAAQREIEMEEISKTGAFLSPEAFAMFFVAGMLDIVGLIVFILSLFGIGIPASFVLDFIGVIIIGGWMFFRTGHVTITRKAGKTIKKAQKKILKRLGLSFLGELIPFFGDIAFCWTLAVYFELKNN